MGYIPKSKLKKVLFSRHFLKGKLKADGILKCHYCINKNLRIEWDNYKSIPSHQKATIDHVLPISKGGGIFDTSNLVVACECCNQKKGSMDYIEFLNTL